MGGNQATLETDMCATQDIGRAPIAAVHEIDRLILLAF